MKKNPSDPFLQKEITQYLEETHSFGFCVDLLLHGATIKEKFGFFFFLFHLF